MPNNYLIFYGSVRSSRQGIKAVRFLEKQLLARGDTFHTADPLGCDFGLLDKMYKEYDPPASAPQKMQELASEIEKADGYLIVTGEYNHTMPPALINLMDHYLQEYMWRPSAIVSYSAGPFGGIRAAMQARAYLCEIGAPSISSTFPISQVQNAFDEEGNPLVERYPKSIGKFLDELDWYADALKAQRTKGVPY